MTTSNKSRSPLALGLIALALTAALVLVFLLAKGFSASPGGERPKESAASPTKESRAAEGKQVASGKGVLVLGDSVTIASERALNKELPGIDIKAKVSAQIWDAPSQLRDLPQAEPGDVVVVALGTNGGPDSGVLTKILEASGKRPVVLVTPYGQRDWIPSTAEAYRSFAQAHPDRVVVADWNSSAAKVTDFAPDGIHPGGQGGKLYAETLSDAIAKARRLQK